SCISCITSADTHVVLVSSRSFHSHVRPPLPSPPPPSTTLFRSVYSLDLATKTTTRLTLGDQPYLYPQWSPDGKRLAVIRGSNERSEEHTSELQSPDHLVCRLLRERKKTLIHCRAAESLIYQRIM